MRITVILILFWLSNTAIAQIGIKTGYLSQQSSGFELVQDQTGVVAEPVIDPALSYSIDYWFRLNKFRIEFIPELNFSRFQVSLLDQPRLRTSQYSFFFNILLYPFDWNNDCDCPTFTKEGNFLSKGFYIYLSPGVSLLSEEALLPEIEGDSGIYGSFAAGAGIDFGIRNRLTLSPEIGLRYFSGYPRENLGTIADIKKGYTQDANNASLLQLVPALRIRFRFDQY